jgi:hypothetical protein
MREDLYDLALRTEELFERADEAAGFITHRVEQARVRDRRRDRRNRTALYAGLVDEPELSTGEGVTA